MSTHLMKSEDTLIRRKNFRRLMSARAWLIADLKKELGWGRYTFWRDLLEDPEKSFGEKLARKIEDAAKLPRGWLDQQGAEQTPIPIDIAAHLKAGAENVHISDDALMAALGKFIELVSEKDAKTRDAATSLVAGVIENPADLQHFKEVMQVMLKLRRSGVEPFAEGENLVTPPTRPSVVPPRRESGQRSQSNPWTNTKKPPRKTAARKKPGGT